MVSKIKVGIVGGAGYTGGELIRILLNHPAAEIIFVHSKSNGGKALHTVHMDLQGETEMKFAAELSNNIDVLFFCLGHGEANRFLSENKIGSKIKVIDLSQDFRLGESFQKRKFVYGLPELNKASIKKAVNIANPGCFATAIQLGLLPLAKAGLLKEIHTTGITGSTGAGQGLNATSHFSWRANNIQAYKTLSHQHLAEIGQSISKSAPSSKVDLDFIPWRGDFTRGIFISSQIKCALSLQELTALYKRYYAAHPFIVVSDEPIFLKQVLNTNKCFIQLEKVGNKLVVHSIIDNLLKGASGQAVQNMNLMFGLEETTGLRLKASYF
ncbi:MAG TPA: N-acetyl-gamma-glutamyl-phosphate reductase [Ferruginibacter sp.]|nr:N-acetyl-gamma-glutamyl-phosphate reductase [Ferruginibacter sp.]